MDNCPARSGYERDSQLLTVLILSLEAINL